MNGLGMGKWMHGQRSGVGNNMGKWMHGQCSGVGNNMGILFIAEALL